jgi:hypothetical protein
MRRTVISSTRQPRSFRRGSSNADVLGQLAAIKGKSGGKCGTLQQVRGRQHKKLVALLQRNLAARDSLFPLSNP